MSQDPMTIDLDAIEQAARAATPGPWRVDAVERIVGPERIRDHGMGPEDDPVVIVETDGGYYPPEPPDLAYLLAATPSTVLALVARIRELEAALGEACEIGDVLLSVADELGGVELPHTESDLERFRALLPR